MSFGRFSQLIFVSRALASVFLSNTQFRFGFDNRNQTFLLSQLGGIGKMCNLVLGFFFYLLILFIN